MKAFPVNFLVISLLLGAGMAVLAAEPMSEEEIEAWFNDSSEDKALRVNEGSLVFLEIAPDKRIHHLHNTFIITQKSLSTGWVDLIQCHNQLDAVPATQVVYRYRRINKLRIESYSGIGRVWVEGKSVQLEEISEDARLCIRAQVGILRVEDGKLYILKNGPFHRKFLDGYYPMQVTLNVRYPSDLIQYHSIRPQQQPGFELDRSDNELTIHALFEGMLVTEVRFRKIGSGKAKKRE